MTENKVVCPVCSSTESICKVSEIYIQSLERLKEGNRANAPVIDRLHQEIPMERREKLKGARYYRQLMESFAPPQGGSQSTRTINPDWIIVGMGLITVFFLYQIFSTQYQVFWFILVFAVIAFACYGIFRKKIRARYLVTKEQESYSKKNIEKEIGQWMKLYYCIKDNVVFKEGGKEAVSIEQMNAYLKDTSH